MLRIWPATNSSLSYVRRPVRLVRAESRKEAARHSGQSGPLQPLHRVIQLPAHETLLGGTLGGAPGGATMSHGFFRVSRHWKRHSRSGAKMSHLRAWACGRRGFEAAQARGA